jgi:hypothetical protein
VAGTLCNYTLARTGRVLSLGTVRVGDEVAMLRVADLPPVVCREDEACRGGVCAWHHVWGVVE